MNYLTLFAFWCCATLYLALPPCLADQKVTVQQVNGYDVYLVDLQIGNSFGYSYVVPYGSADDEPQFFGRAHFFEHMMGRGSIKYPGHETLINKMTSLGYQRNAATGLDLTYYYAFGNEQNALQALDYGLAPLAGIELEPDSFAKEKKTVINEIIDTAPSRPERAVFALPFAYALPQGHALKGHHVGTLETLLPMSPADLQQLHAKVYRPGLVKVAIFANFTSGLWKREQILAALKTTLPQNFKTQVYNSNAQPGPLFGLQQGPQILEIEGQKKPNGAIYFELPEGVDRQKVEIFLEAFATANRGGITNYLYLQKNWLSEMSTWTTRTGKHQLAAIFFDLTDEGYKNRDQVVQYLLSAIKTYQHESLSAQVMTRMQDRLNAVAKTRERDLESLIRQFPSWLTTPHDEQLVSMNWGKAFAQYTPENVMVGAQSLDLGRILIAFQGSADFSPQGKDPVFALKYQRRHLPATALFPVSLPATPNKVITSEVKLQPTIKSGLLLKTPSWRQVDGITIGQNNLTHWQDRTVEINWVFGRLTALEELSLQAWINGFYEEFTPEFVELKAQGVDVGFSAGGGTMSLNVSSRQPVQLATMQWLIEKLKTYSYDSGALARFIEKKQKALRSREFGFPANVGVGLASTMLSPRGLSAPQFEKVLPELNLELIKKTLATKIFKTANKSLFFAGSFYESEIAQAKGLALAVAPENLENLNPVGDRFAVNHDHLAFFEPWTFSGGEGVGAVRLLKAPAASRIIEVAALAVTKKILHDNVFLTNRPYGYVQGAGTLVSSVLDQHLMFYGQANNETDLAKIHSGWEQALNRWRKNEISNDEIQNAKAGLISKLQQTPSSSAEGVAELSNGFYSYGHPFYNKLLLGALMGLTIDQIREIAAHYLAEGQGQLTITKGAISSLCENLLTDRTLVRQRLKR